MNTQNNKVGLEALLTPENSVLVLIDHQAFQFANTRNMDPTMIFNNTIGLAKAAKVFKVPTILTTVTSDRGGEVTRLKIVLVAIPWTELPAVISELSPWDGRVVIDANNHILGFDGNEFQLADRRGRTSSELFSEMVPGARVVKALNTLASAVLAQEPRIGSGRRVIFISGDEAVSKKTVGDLLESVGFSPIDLGTLAVGGRLRQAGASLAGMDLVSIS
jgi:predicted dinucleotide-binding enzyme